jgi:LacI family transcriptional regulator
VPTVSKVLNGRSDVSAATRNRVMELVAETGYRRRGGPAARPAGDRLIDLVLTSVSGGWANQVLSGVERAASEAGFDLIVTVARPDPLTATGVPPRDWVARLLARSSQGAVLALVSATADQHATLRAAGIPVVLLDPVEQPPESVASVGATNWPAGRDVAMHLLRLGHRRLAVLAGGAGPLYSRARVDGFTSAIRPTAGGSPEPAAEVRVVNTDGRNSAAEVAGRLLDDPDRPTAIFACSDNLAFAVFEAANERGLRIPDDLSLVGFDDLPEASWAGLTTVRQPIAEMGAAALRLLLRMRGSERSFPREELATSLIVRSSTGPVPA